MPTAANDDKKATKMKRLYFPLWKKYSIEHRSEKTVRHIERM